MTPRPTQQNTILFITVARAVVVRRNLHWPPARLFLATSALLAAGTRPASFSIRKGGAEPTGHLLSHIKCDPAHQNSASGVLICETDEPVQAPMGQANGTANQWN
ncbi:hypothetical protein [Bradyrhizobium sp. B117]|uniref:hypothetical protein n=1 Tax=Bradyrhizobium sp. B117 TaxID=3140246 RepID=UPI003182C24E